MATSTQQPQTFVPNERVLCYHGPLVYEAKVLKSEVWDETTTITGLLGPNYFVHYKGWKQTWDEWVPAQRILKFNEQNLALQKQLKATVQAATATATSSSTSSKTSKSGIKDGKAGAATSRKEGARGTKRGREEDDGTKRPDLRISIPDTLKVRLVDDWENVTKNNQLVTLPRTPNVREILAQFKSYVLDLPAASKTHLPTPQTLMPTVLSGLQLYFDRSLGANLLYRFERPQYAEIRRRYITGQNVIIGQEKEMSEVYGAEHLLRMIVSLPSMVASSTMDQESVNILREYVHELMQYMALEQKNLFQLEYEDSSSQYQNLSRS